jgi:inositol phosphorylceramide mannosyltransferase catalytic subunit
MLVNVMAIPKTIYQTFKTKKLPWLSQWHIARMRRRNPQYVYEFYDDERINDFILSAYGERILNLYQRIDIGAAKADFFRYAILYKKGGVYLDIDSLVASRLDDFILPGDEAVISMEAHPGIYVQWALVYSAGHPFLKKTMEIIIDNLENNRFPNDVHKMTGPTAYSTAINECLKEDPDIPYRLMGIDYNGCFKFHYPMSKFFLYSGKQHWKKAQLSKPILKN